MTVQCLLSVYYPNYSVIRGNSHLFLKNVNSNLLGGSIGQSRFVCKKYEHRSKFTIAVLVFKASMLYYLGGPSAKEGLSAKYEHRSKFTIAVLVFKASMLYYLGGPLAKKVHLPNMNTCLNLLLLHRRSLCSSIQAIYS